MTPLAALIGSAAILFTILTARWLRQRRAQHISLTLSHDLSSTDHLKATLNPPDATLKDLVHARALPNERLSRAFDLHNAFVSDSLDVRRQFIKHASRIIQVCMSLSKRH
jgi:hypothetical protein